MRADPSSHGQIVDRELHEAKRPTVHPLTIQPPLRAPHAPDDDFLSRYTTWVTYNELRQSQCWRVDMFNEVVTSHG
jgi:hypothetical protein